MPARARSFGSIASTIDDGAVVANQFDAALGHFVAGMPHDGVAQRALAGAVGAHQGVNFAAVDLEVHAPENRLAVDRRRADR